MTGVPSREVIFLQIPSWTASVLAGFFSISVLGIAQSGQAGAFSHTNARFQIGPKAQVVVAMRQTFNINVFLAPAILPSPTNATVDVPASSNTNRTGSASTVLTRTTVLNTRTTVLNIVASKAAAQVVASRSRSSRAVNAIVVRSTAYNSLSTQTDRTPHITATGARTRFGVVALSRDLLRQIPYGSQVRITDLGHWRSGKGRGQYNGTLSDMLFVVEDTMHARKSRQIDVWFPSYRAAVRWGVRQVRIEVVRYGRSRY
jgi:3D (Asp-Asp-Asp) domain-containing protein